MRLTILGSGTGVPSIKRGAPGALLQVQGKNILIDIGSGIIQKILKKGISYLEIDAIILTHLHPDHVSDLLPFFFASKYRFAPRTKELYLLGGRGLREYYDGLRQLYGHWAKAETFLLHIQEIRHGKRNLLGLELTTFPLDHTPSSIGLRFEHQRKVLAYSGDTDYCPQVVEMAKDADLLVLECSFPDDCKIKGHLTPSLAGKIAREAQARRLLLTHLYPSCDTGDVLVQCKREFSGTVQVAEDMLEVIV